MRAVSRGGIGVDGQCVDVSGVRRGAGASDEGSSGRRSSGLWGDEQRASMRREWQAGGRRLGQVRAGRGRRWGAVGGGPPTPPGGTHVVYQCGQADQPCPAALCPAQPHKRAKQLYTTALFSDPARRASQAVWSFLRRHCLPNQPKQACRAAIINRTSPTQPSRQTDLATDIRKTRRQNTKWVWGAYSAQRGGHGRDKERCQTNLPCSMSDQPGPTGKGGSRTGGGPGQGWAEG